MQRSLDPAVGDVTSLRAILVDYGGTLDGDAAHWFDHFLRLHAECGAALPASTLLPAFYGADARLTALPDVRGFGLERMVRTHVGYQLELLGRDDPAFATRLAEGFMRDTRAAWDRNRPLLRRLARRFRLGVVSNSYGNMTALLADGDLGPFDVVVDSVEVGLAKPDPAIYALAAERLALAPGEILHVGDSWERDVVAAAAAGMRVAWLAAADAEMPASPAPVWRLASLRDLETLLR